MYPSRNSNLAGAVELHDPRYRGEKVSRAGDFYLFKYLLNLYLMML